jgi:hypothetical protein
MRTMPCNVLFTLIPGGVDAIAKGSVNFIELEAGPDMDDTLFMMPMIMNMAPEWKIDGAGIRKFEVRHIEPQSNIKAYK